MSEGTPRFSIEEIERIAELANLELTEGEKETFAQQFGEILEYFRKIAGVSTDSIPAYAGTDPDPHFRPDRQESSGVDPESFSNYLENDHFKVPRVIE